MIKEKLIPVEMFPLVIIINEVPNIRETSKNNRLLLLVKVKKN